MDTPQAVIAGNLLHDGVEKNGDFLVVSGFVRHGGGAGKVIFPYQNGHMSGKFRQKNAFLRRRKTAADHENVLIPEKRAVAGGAVGNAVSPEFLLAPETRHFRLRPGGQKYAYAAKIPRRGFHGLLCIEKGQLPRLRNQEFRAEVLRLTAHGVGKLHAAGLRHAGVVYHLIGNGDLPAVSAFFQHKRPTARSGKVQRRRQPRRAAAYDDDIVKLFFHHGIFPSFVDIQNFHSVSVRRPAKIIQSRKGNGKRRSPSIYMSSAGFIKYTFF